MNWSNWWRHRELFKYAGRGDISGVMRLFRQRLVHVNATNLRHKTPLYVACKNGHTAVVQYLLDNGADVSCGRTHPLIAAVRYNHYDCVKLLLEYHADANCRVLRRKSPISVAMRKHPGNIKLILLLLQHGAIPSTSFGDDISAQLLENATAEHAEGMQKLIEENLINLTSENTFLAAFDFVFKRASSVELAEKILSNDSYSQFEHLYKEAVYYSAKNNWPNILSKLLEKRVDVNALTEGETPLNLACERGKNEIVKLLLSHGADPNIATVGPHPHTYPIQAACRGLHYDAVKLLLEYNADVNVRGRTDHTVLHCALSRPIANGDKRRDLVQLLLDAGADVNAASEEGETPFYIACSKGLESVVEKMLECGAKVDGNSVKKLPLVAACRNKHISMVRLLLTSGANPNLQEESDDYCRRSSLPLWIAAKKCANTELLELLLKHGADVDITDIEENTPLHYAISRMSWSPKSDNVIPVVVDILMEYKANVNKVNKDGYTPLLLAAAGGFLGVVNKMLGEYGGNPNTGSLDKNPLVVACLKQNVALVDTLLKHGADPNSTWTSCAPDSEHICPLLVAVCEGNTDIITLLLNAGANVNSTDGDGYSVLWYPTAKLIVRGDDLSAEEIRNKLSTVLLLLQHGADVNMLMPNARSPLYLGVTGLRGERRRKPEYRKFVVELLQLMVNHGAKLCESSCQQGNNVSLQVLATFDGEHDFIVELFRAGAGFKLLASCCLVLGLPPERSHRVKSINLCQAAVLAGYAPGAGELQKLHSAAASDNTSGHQIQQLVNWLKEDRQQVPSLLRQCRIVVRRQLSAAARFQSILPAIDKLPLPTILKLYIKFDGPLSEVDLNVCMPTRQ